jgi:4,5-dihydroxyphthalate decarboxylase
MPFLLDALERQRRAFGPDPWRYGVAANRTALDAFAASLPGQGLVGRRLEPEELFAASWIDEARV